MSRIFWELINVTKYMTMNLAEALIGEVAEFLADNVMKFVFKYYRNANSKVPGIKL